MEPSRRPFKEWFGYSRRERRSSFILIVLIFILTGVRYFIPEKSVSVSETGLVIPVQPVAMGGQTRYGGSVPENKRTNIRPLQRPLLDINKCDSVSLVALPGIGPVLSARIIKYRNLLGGFVSVNQLKEVYGLPEATFDIISGRLFADSAAVKKIDINNSDFTRLIRFPYLTRFEVTSILRYRDLSGNISSVAEMVRNKLINEETAAKVRHYLYFGE